MEKEGKVTVKGLIKEALLELMMEKTYPDITVTDIIKKAQVARVSYYRNFTSIDGILDDIVEDRIKELDSKIKPLMLGEGQEEEWKEFLTMIFNHKLSKKDTFSTMREKNKPYLYSKMDEKIQGKFIEIGREKKEGMYVLPAKLGVISSVSNAWLKTGTKETPEEMANLVYELMKKI